MTLRSMVRGAAERVMCALPRRTRPGDRLILAYHNVVPADWAPRGDRSLHLSIDKFEAQLRMIRNEAEIVPLMDLLTTDAPSDRRVAITFDDAYASALTLGVGACVAADAPCTVFVAPGLLGHVPSWDMLAERGQWSNVERHRFLWEQHGLGAAVSADADVSASVTLTLRISSEAELLSACGQMGVTVGNHTMHHMNLGALSTAEAECDLQAAAGWLQERFPSTAPVVAYPYGIPPRDREAAVHSAGLTHGLNVAGGWWHAGRTVSLLAVPRWNVPAGISVSGFRLRLRGWFATD